MAKGRPQDGFLTKLQLVIEPQDSRRNFRFGDLRDGAVCSVPIMAAADPVSLSSCDLFAAERPAFPAVDVFIIEAALFCTVCPLELLLAGGHQFLYSLEIRTAYDGRVTVLYKVAGLLAKVSNLPEWNRICGAAFLPDHISGISDIGQDVGHRTGMPLLTISASVHPDLVQFPGDIILSLAAQISGEDAADHLRYDLQISPRQPVAIGDGRWDKQSLFHPHTDTEAHITGVVGRFHLGESSIDLGNLLRGHLPGIDVLLLKVDRNTQPEQFSHELNVLLCVACKARDRFAEDPVDLSLSAIGHHPVEIISIPCFQPGDTLIGIDVYHLPVLFTGDVLGVEVYLGDVGVDLIFGVTAHSGVGCYPQLCFFGDSGVDHRDLRNSCCTYVCFRHIFFDLLSATHTTTVLPQ